MLSCRKAILLWNLKSKYTAICTFIFQSYTTRRQTSKQVFFSESLLVRKGFCYQWGAPLMDLFATEQNKKCKVFFSKGGQSRGSPGDNFLIPWIQCLLYAYPPNPLILCLKKVRQNKATFILVALDLPRQYWFTEIRNLLVTPSVPLSLLPDLITQNNRTTIHPDVLSLHFIKWKLSGNRAE